MEQSGLFLFEKLHNYKASFFVPANGPLNHQLEKNLSQDGIKYISTSKIDNEPQGNRKFKKRFY